MNNFFRKVLSEVKSEREKQDLKWGVQDHDPLKWNAILGEEFGEVSKSILEDDSYNYRQELIQVAAVAIAAVECHDRRIEEAHDLKDKYLNDNKLGFLPG